MGDLLSKIDWVQVAAGLTPLIVAAFTAFVAPALRAWLKAKGKTEHQVFAAELAHAAYWVVEQIARKTPGEIDDKIAMALKLISEQLGRTLKEPEQEMFKTSLKAIHEKRKATSLTLATMKAGRTQLGNQ